MPINLLEINGEITPKVFLNGIASIDNGETIISSFQDNNYKLQYNENGNYFGSFIGINNNMKIYIITEE